MTDYQFKHFDTRRLNAISITEVARRLGCDLSRKGTNFVTNCPWHDDDHPSLTFYERTDENRCHCFSCGKGGSVIDLTMQNEGWTFQEACQWLSREFGIGTGSAPPPLQPIRKPQTASIPVEPTYTYIPTDMVERMVSTANSLCQCLMKLFNHRQVEWLCEEYRIGTYAMGELDDYTVFPNIDRYGRVCNLKIQHYDTDLESPRFAHSDKAGCFWLGAMWAKDGVLPKDAKFQSQCLFGEHLLSNNPDSTIALVERPKNALFGALQHPQLTWVATGSKNMLKRNVLEPLRGRDIIVIPDRDAITPWAQALTSMADLANFTVSDFCRRVAPEEQAKYDIADYIQGYHMPF